MRADGFLTVIAKLRVAGERKAAGYGLRTASKVKRMVETPSLEFVASRKEWNKRNVSRHFWGVENLVARSSYLIKSNRFNCVVLAKVC
jgi:hypothetical protein